MRTDRRPAALVLLALLLATAAYARVLGGELQLDDVVGIERNPAVKDLRAFVAALPAQLAAGARPLTDLTFAVNYALGRLDPRGFHLVNLAVHLGAVVLVWAFTRRVARLARAARPEWIAAGVAAVFAVHPLQSQAVSYVSQRAESLASALYLATLLLLLEAGRRRGAAAGAALAGAALAFLAGLGAKPIVVTAPVAWLLVAWALSSATGAREELGTPRWRLAVAAPALALAAAFSAATLRSVEGTAEVGFEVPGLTPWTYLLTQLRVIVIYLRLLAWPAGQNADWDVSPSAALEPAVVGAGLLLLALAGGAVLLLVRARGRDDAAAGAARLAGLGVLWFLLVLAPTSSVVPIVDVVFEHRVYLAAWGVLVAAAAGAERLAARLPPKRAPLAAGALVAVVGALALTLHLRNAVWETRRAFWEDVVAKSPRKARGHLGLGWVRSASGDFAGAAATFEAGLRLVRPEEPGVEVKLLTNLGTALLNDGRLDEAIAVYQRALERSPGAPDVVANVGIAHERKRDFDAAERWLELAIAAEPREPRIWNALGALHLRRGDFAGALRLLERTRALDPDFGEGQFNLGQAYSGLGRRDEACAAWREAATPRTAPPFRGEAERLVRAHCG